MACSTKEPRMTVAGECTPAWEGEKIYLETGNNFIDSCTIKNGKFKFDLSNLKEPGEAVVSRFNKKTFIGFRRTRSSKHSRDKQQNHEESNHNPFSHHNQNPLLLSLHLLFCFPFFLEKFLDIHNFY